MHAYDLRCHIITELFNVCDIQVMPHLWYNYGVLTTSSVAIVYTLNVPQLKTTGAVGH